MNKILEIALEYSKNGFSIMPVYPNSKNPVLIEWQQFSYRKPTLAEINKWFNNNKTYNIGIVCGEASNNLEILDIDDPRIFEAFFSDIKTLQIRTQSGGYHLYFKVNRFSTNRVKLDKWPIDFRTNGGFVMAPPSEMNEKKWTIARESEIAEIENLEEFVRARLPQIETPFELEEVFLKSIPTITILKKYITTEIKSIGNQQYQTNCPFPNHDDKTPSFAIYEDHYYCFGCHEIGNAIDFVQKIKKVTRNEAISQIEKITGRKFKKDNKKTTLNKIENYLKHLTKEWNIKTVEDNTILMYENGIYVPAEKKLAQDLALNFHLKNIPSKQVFFTFIRDITSSSYEEFDKDPYIINLKNGLYSLKEKKLLAHTPDYLSQIQLPIEYHSDAKCPATNKFMHEIANKKHRRTLWEILGYSMFTQKETQQAFITYGNGANGKSKYLNMLARIIGKNHVRRLTLAEIEESHFSTAELKNKLLNIGVEKIGSSTKTIEKLKQLTGETEIEGEIKFVQKRLSFKVITTFIFTTNEILALEDPKYAEIRRLVFLHFPNQFKGKNRDLDIDTKLGTKEEMEGQLLKGLNALEEVLKNRIVYDPLSDESKEELLEKGSNQIDAFLNDEFDWDLENEKEPVWIEGQCFYEMLKKYCKKNCLIPPSNYKFKRLLNTNHRLKYTKFESGLDIDRIKTAKIQRDGIRYQVWKMSPINQLPLYIKLIEKKDDIDMWLLK